MENEILFVAIARKKKTILCEYAQCTGNFQQISLKILLQLNRLQEHKYFSITPYDNYNFFSYVNEDLIILAVIQNRIASGIFDITEEDSKNLMPVSNHLFSFLYHLHKELYVKYSETELKKCHAYKLFDFVAIISDSITEYDNNRECYSDFMQEISLIQVCDSNYTKKNNESKLSIIRNSLTGKTSRKSSGSNSDGNNSTINNNTRNSDIKKSLLLNDNDNNPNLEGDINNESMNTNMLTRNISVREMQRNKTIKKLKIIFGTIIVIILLSIIGTICYICL